MPALARKSNYPGIPEEQIPLLEAVLQATVTALWAASRKLLGVLPADDLPFGDADYFLRRGPSNTIVCTDSSAGWWALLQLGDSAPEEFQVYAQQGLPPQHIPGWEQLEVKFLEGKADLYLHAYWTGKMWTSQEPHNIHNGSHPLLRNLHTAAEKLASYCLGTSHLGWACDKERGHSGLCTSAGDSFNPVLKPRSDGNA